jgi:hypothetical protein
MAALVGNLTSVWNPVDLTLHFARQPEPDLEFTDEELDQTVATKGRSPLNPRKKSGGGSPVLWLLLLALVGGIAYVAIIEPEMLEEWLSPYLGETTPTPVAMKPKPLPTAPVAPPAPAPQAAQTPNPAASAPPSPIASPPTTAPATTPAVVPPPKAAAPATQTAPPLDPMFSEGQKVTVTGDQVAPGGTIPLFADPAGINPGPLVRLGVSLTVMDGDLQPSGWMYMVRTDDGTKGWVSEKRLRLKF